MTHGYSVRPRDSVGPIRIFEEPAAEAAAAAFLEDWLPQVQEGGEATVIVRELATGREHCFRVDLETGQTQPCG